LVFSFSPPPVPSAQSFFFPPGRDTLTNNLIPGIRANHCSRFPNLFVLVIGPHRVFAVTYFHYYKCHCKTFWPEWSIAKQSILAPGGCMVIYGLQFSHHRQYCVFPFSRESGAAACWLFSTARCLNSVVGFFEETVAAANQGGTAAGRK